MASSVHCVKSNRWYSYLSQKDQKVLDSENMFVSSNSIPDDLVNGVSINDITKLTKIAYQDHQNISMFPDGFVDCMTFQQQIKKFAYEYSQNKINPSRQLKPEYGAQQHSEKSIKEVPNIVCLKEEVNSFLFELDSTYNKAKHDSWNGMFHQILIECGIQKYYPSSNLPECYIEGNSCGHILHVELDDTLMAMTFIDPSTGWFEISKLPDKEKSSARISQLFNTTWLWHNTQALGRSFLTMVQNSRKISYLFYMTLQ